MKKRLFFVFYIFVFSMCFIYGETKTVRLLSAFRLNPILGINGDDNEASSKFVQRLIYSSLVFPLQDPFLQGNYDISLELSLIESVEYSYDAGRWMLLNLNDRIALTSAPGYIYYRVKLREGLEFNRIGMFNRASTYDSLDVEDVVYSYRISRITMDRAYQRYLNANDEKLGLNSLMYTKIKSFSDVYCKVDNTRYVYFKMDSNKTGEEFLKLLVYVPILSSKQIRGETMKRASESAIFKSIHSELDFLKLNISNTAYDIYDINESLLDDRGNVNNTGRDFYDRPIGYGQFLVIRQGNRAGGGGRDQDLWEEIHLARNSNWCSFSDNTFEDDNGNILDHKKFSDRESDRLIIKRTYDTDATASIMALTNNDVVYNTPLSASMFLGPELRAVSIDRDKQKMQISHSLYGIFFGPAIHDVSLPLYKEVRDFFASFASDRVRLENIVKYISGDTQFENFDNEISVGTSILEDVSMQKLYFPFYNSGQELNRYYELLESKDEYFQQYNDMLSGENFADYYKKIQRLGDRNDFYRDYIAGIDYTGSTRNKMDLAFQNARNYMTAQDGIIHIEIIYKNLPIDTTIATRFQRTLEAFFFANGINNSVNLIDKPIDDYSSWRTIATNNAKSGKLSLLVKGWNYKFDFLDELKGEWVDKSVFQVIEGLYRQMIDNSMLSADTVFYHIAQEFVDNTVMIPLIGVQNYAVHNIGKFQSFKNYKDIEIMMLPYYWDWE